MRHTLPLLPGRALLIATATGSPASLAADAGTVERQLLQEVVLSPGTAIQ